MLGHELGDLSIPLNVAPRHLYFNFTAKFLSFIQPFFHSFFHSALGRLEARCTVLVRVLVHPRTEIGVRGFGLVRRHRFFVDIIRHVRREVAKSNHRRTCCGGAGHHRRTCCGGVEQSWLRRMRHESFGGNLRASAAAWMSFRLSSIPCMHRKLVRSCPFTEFAGPAGVGANAAHSERTPPAALGAILRRG